MKLSEFRKIVREELVQLVKERYSLKERRSIVPSREPPRKMTKPQVGARTTKGDAAIDALKHKDPAKAAKFRDGGNDEADIFWAGMTNRALGENIIRLRDIAPLVVLQGINSLKKDVPLREELPPMESEDDFDAEPDNSPSVTRAQLLHIHKQSAKLYNLLGDADEMEDWMIDKITKAEEYVSSVANHVEYEKSKPTSLPADGQALPTIPQQH